MARTVDIACRIGVATLLGSLVPAGARAEHDMAMHDHSDASEVSIGLSVEAAEFDNTAYVGSYQGVTPQVGWMHRGFGASAALGIYHITENGLSLYGVGDAMFAGHATVFASETVQTGIALHAMVPTGSELHGFGMGHVMAMPAGWATWHAHAVTATARAGYSRALASLGSGHVHGQMPLVDPMNGEELTFSAAADVEVGSGVRVGGRTEGGIPLGTGVTRVIGAGRVAWGTPHVSTALEMQLGLAGDPFTIRGVVETTLRF